MDEHDPRFGAMPNESVESTEDEEALGARIAAAGPRPPLPPEALAALHATVRTALGAPEAPGPSERDARQAPPAGRRWRLAAAACLAIGFGWFTFRTLLPSRSTPVASIEAATGPLEVEIGKGYWREVRVGERLFKEGEPGKAMISDWPAMPATDRLSIEVGRRSCP